jgi:acetyltransferase-like isoleucine patch superfamily enzyme
VPADRTRRARDRDYATLNEGSALKAHSLEEGVFKSDYVRVGSGFTIGCGALVHYGVRIGDNVVIDPDSFLMKGETPDANTTWRGNPARSVRKAALKPALREVPLPAASGPAMPEKTLAAAAVDR